MLATAFLTRQNLESAFHELGLRARAADKIVEIAAMRIGGADEFQDRSDIEVLAREIGVVTAEQALDIVSQYYPLSRISPKTQYGVEEIFSRLPRAGDPEP